MFQSPNFQLVVSIFLALIPAFIWALYFFEPKDKNAKFFLKVFLGGTLTVFPILGLQYAYIKFAGAYPNLDFVDAIKDNVPNFYIITVITYAWVGISEELIKFFIVKYADNKHPEVTNTINGVLKFGLLSGLGFAFSENIFYFYNIWKNLGLEGLLAPFLFRSTFTVCAHLMFSGIFAYYYGNAKFAEDFINFKKWKGEKVDNDEYKKFRRKNILIGLILSMFLHALFNSLLELSGHLKNGQTLVIAVILLVAGMFFFLSALLRKNSGNLRFIQADKHISVMQKSDIDVLMEYIGIRFSEGKYEEVIGMCERLLHRDPDNNVAKIFKAKSEDKIKKNKEKSE
jgi:RsiW-degrading membrane proteinase PrsW (M82 family)